MFGYATSRTVHGPTLDDDPDANSLIVGLEDGLKKDEATPMGLISYLSYRFEYWLFSLLSFGQFEIQLGM